jgi:hypothetical protein
MTSSPSERHRASFKGREVCVIFGAGFISAHLLDALSAELDAWK